MARRYGKVLTLRIPELLDRVADLRAEESHIDKATAMRQWIHEGAERYLLGRVADGRLSTGRAAELLGVSVYDVQRLAQLYEIELGPSDEQLVGARSTGTHLQPRSTRDNRDAAANDSRLATSD